jgi:hypothetical protein
MNIRSEAWKSQENPITLHRAASIKEWVALATGTTGALRDQDQGSSARRES